MSKIPVIIDCDPGHDDAIAMLMALASDRLDIIGIVTSAGNQTVEKTAVNAMKILELCQRTDVPVAVGRSKPLMNPLVVGEKTHGPSGMDGPVLPDPAIRPVPESAAEFIAEKVSESPEPVTLVITGPCTNTAVFLMAYPHLRTKITKISIMGGGAFMGNRTALAEFNIWNDPEAGKIVVNSGIPVEMYGLDVTHEAIIYQAEFSLFRNRPDPISQFVADLLDFFAIDYMNVRKFPGCPIHDACAVAGLIAPELFEYYSTDIDVDIEGRYTRGACAVDLQNCGSEGMPVQKKIAMKVNREGFLELMLESCARLNSCSQGGKG